MKENKFGTLYMVSTPVGNLEDISYRAVKTLKEADMIAAEDTRHTLKLLNHFSIKKTLISYFEHNKKQRGEELIHYLQKGVNIALVTDAGTPGISDPGEDLVKLAVAHDILVTMIPGPAAFIMGLVLSGLSCERFCFEGFLSHDKKERKERLESLCNEDRTLIFYVSPHRVLNVLNDIQSIFGNRKIALCRELTKKHEEILRGPLDEIIGDLAMRERVKGEMVLVVEGASQPTNNQDNPLLLISMMHHMQFYIEKGMDQKEAMKQVARDRNMTKRDVYSAWLLEKDK